MFLQNVSLKRMLYVQIEENSDPIYKARTYDYRTDNETNSSAGF